MAELKPFEVIFKLSPGAVKHDGEAAEVCFMAEKVQELVRCKDCYRFETDWFCPILGLNVSPNWFCADGRKDGGTEDG